MGAHGAAGRGSEINVVRRGPVIVDVMELIDMGNQPNYSVLPLAERPVSRVCGVTFPESEDYDTDLVFLHLEDPPQWYRLCLGEGVAYCDTISAESASEELAEYKDRLNELMDCSNRLIVTLAHEFELTAGSPAQVSIDFSNGLNLGFRCRRDASGEASEVLIRPLELAERKVVR